MKYLKRMINLSIAAVLLFSALTGLTGCRTGLPAEGETERPFVNPYDEAENTCLAHRFTDGECQQCGVAYTPSEGLAYILSEVGEGESAYFVSGMGDCKDTQLMIPATHEGLPVLGIYPRAFIEVKTLTYVHLPEGATTIGEWAFQGCSKLRRVEIPSTVQHIGREAFEDCLRLTEAVIPEGITALNEGTFQSCVNLTAVTLPTTLTEIHSSAFKGCRSLAEITIPTGVQMIDSHAFSNCDGLIAVYYNGSMKDWCGIDFGLVLANPVSVAGHLYIQGQLIEGVLTLPDGVVDVTRNALEGLVDITAVVFPESVENTGSFQGCVNLEYLLFKGSPVYTGDTYSFENTGLTHVYLSDTKEDAIKYIPYLAAACKAVEAHWHYADAWEYDDSGVPQLKPTNDP